MEKILYEWIEEIDAIVDTDGNNGKLVKDIADKINEIVDWINSQ
jgi:hypothetical protein